MRATIWFGSDLPGWRCLTYSVLNNDGINDMFKPMIANDRSNYNCTILNRWGEIVFQSYTIQNGWSDQSNDKLFSAGVYMWII